MRPSLVNLMVGIVMARIILLACLLFLVLPVSAAPQTPAVIAVEMREFAFQPALIRLTADRPVRLVFANRGQIAHQFESDYLRQIPARVMDVTLSVETAGLEFVRLAPGSSATVEFLPRRRGRFTFACTIEGHREAGMHGVLEVR